MQLERKHIMEDSKKRKMVHVKSTTHAQITRLADETGYSVTDLTDILLCDALARVELVDAESEVKADES